MFNVSFLHGDVVEVPIIRGRIDMTKGHQGFLLLHQLRVEGLQLLNHPILLLHELRIGIEALLHMRELLLLRHGALRKLHDNLLQL